MKMTMKTQMTTTRKTREEQQLLSLRLGLGYLSLLLRLSSPEIGKKRMDVGGG